MIDYVGVISREDARLLRYLAESSRRILEFGSGASTQIFAAYGRGSVESVETDPAWIEKTKRNLAAIRPSIAKPVTFCDLSTFQPNRYDLIFVDGPDRLRLAFAFLTWPFLATGGIMAFHDTRRTAPHGDASSTDIENVCAIIRAKSTEIAVVELNAHDSNTTTIFKRAPLIYEDWQKTEGRTDAQMGL